MSASEAVDEVSNNTPITREEVEALIEAHESGALDAYNRLSSATASAYSDAFRLRLCASDDE